MELCYFNPISSLSARCDVVAICDVTSWLCWKLASLPSELFCREEDASDMRNWHSLCSSMLVNMVRCTLSLVLFSNREDFRIIKSYLFHLSILALLYLWVGPKLKPFQQRLHFPQFLDVNDRGGKSTEPGNLVFRHLLVTLFA